MVSLELSKTLLTMDHQLGLSNAFLAWRFSEIATVQMRQPRNGLRGKPSHCYLRQASQAKKGSLCLVSMLTRCSGCLSGLIMLQ